MTERPILMSAPMVRAILAGTKTQTRRVVKPQPTHFNPAGVPRRVNPDGGASAVIACPYGQSGDRLWVREAFGHFERNDTLKQGDRIYYRTDGECVELHPWRPSIHMPRWASRITLEVTGVRVERLQDISEADAVAEGIERGDGFPGWYRGPLAGDSPSLVQCGFKIPTAFPRLAYRALWESINGPGSWDANPWVWCVEFRRTDR